MKQEINLLPFNLEEALKNPERVVYRNGEKPLEWHYFKYAQWQIVSITPQKEIQVNYENGANHCYDEFDEYLGTNSSHDLLLLPITEKRYWVNLYKDHESNDILFCGHVVFDSEDGARFGVDFTRHFLKTISFTI